MEQDDKQGVCEAQDSQDKGMGSDFENCEDREGDPDERGMGSNPQDADKREGHLGQEMGSDPQDEAPRGHSEERELMSNICTEGLLSEEDGVASREEEDDQSGVVEMAMFPGLSESDSISRSPQEEEEEESAGENRLEEEEEQPPPAVLPWRRHLSLGSRHRGDKPAHRRFRRLHHPMSMDLGELDSLMASIMDAPTICPDCGESFSPGAAFLQHQRIHRLAEAAAAASLEPFGFAGECEAVVGMMGVGGGFGAGPALARPPREKPFRCGDCPDGIQVTLFTALCSHCDEVGHLITVTKMLSFGNQRDTQDYPKSPEAPPLDGFTEESDVVSFYVGWITGKTTENEFHG
ncbi:hypothetical protein E5288_WYG007054 [Bos mutus]|uniref:C2H2-type domain-containing protein n=1 Tax=Bos mutus TaxID=72004 RepID=A0A6B0QPG1_9CETA|nr:hypothetical protein [Bos mutus]